MSNTKLAKVLVATIMVAIVLVSGFSVASNATTPKPAAVPAQPLYIAMQQDMPNFNTFDIASNSVWKANVIGWNWDTLAGQAVDGSIYPLLAQNWTMNMTSLTLTVYLRHNVTFSNGLPLTAKDVVFSYYALRYGTTYSDERFIVPFDTNNNGIVSYSEISHYVKYVNDYTLTIQMRQVYASFYLMTLGIPIIPMSIWQSHLNPGPSGNATFVNSATGQTNGVVNTLWNSVTATIGTGQFYYDSGVAGAYRIEKLNPNYWGKNFVSPGGYKIYPQNVSELYFKIYTDVNTAVLALQSGDVNYIAWSLLASQVPVLAADPLVKLFYSPSDGYFYLAFNEAQQPMNNINFRYAISYLINKPQIVQNYMGGYGQAGDSAVPPFFSAWYNSTLTNLNGTKFSYNPTLAANILTGAGYKINPATGWRTLPDGTPMPAITILTPPANYDPIRIKTGEALASQMRSIGINAAAKPIDFGALVAQFTSFNYQMLTLGWVNFPTAINALSAIFGNTSNSNSLAFWKGNTNPNFPQITSLADSKTVQLSDQFNSYVQKALTTFDINKQIQYVKQAQGVLYQADPQDQLYYTLNIEAATTNWQGWFSWYGSIYNLYSLASLRTGVAAPVIAPTQKTIVAGINAPSQVMLNDFNPPAILGYNPLSGAATKVPVSVFVVNNFGQPVSGASVVLKGSNNNVTLLAYNGTTDSSGTFATSAVGNTPGFTTFTATVTSGGLTTNATTVIQAVDLVPNFLYVNAAAGAYSLTGGQNTTVNVQVVDRMGNPVKGANVSIDPNLIGYGTVSSANATSNSNGIATFTYYAVSAKDMTGKYLNSNLQGKLVITATAPGYLASNKVSLVILNYNPNPSTWHTVHIITATNYTVNQTSLKTTVTIQTVNAANVPMNDTLAIIPSAPGYLASPTTVNTTTTANGFANVTLTFNAALKTTAIGIKFVNDTVTNALADVLTIAYVNPAMNYNASYTPTHLLGGIISFYDPLTGAQTNFVTISSGMTIMSVSLYNLTNQHPLGNTPIGVIVSSVVEGPPLAFYDPSWTNPAAFSFNTLWEYTSVAVTPTYGTGFASSGYFVSQLDNLTKDPVLSSWLPPPWYAGVPSAISAFEYIYGGYGIYLNNSYAVNGTGTYYLLGSGMGSLTTSPVMDRISNVYVVPFSYTWYPQTSGIYTNVPVAGTTMKVTVPVTGAFQMIGSEALMSQLGIQRSDNYMITSVGINNVPIPGTLPWWSSTPYLPFAFAGQPITVYGTLTNQTNAPVSGMNYWAYAPTKVYHSVLVHSLTASDGTVTISMPTFSVNTYTVADLYLSGPNIATAFGTIGSPAGWNVVPISSSTQIMIVPNQFVVTASIVGSNLVTIGSKINVLVTVTDQYGNPVSGATVTLGASQGTVSSAYGLTMLTGPDGTALFTVDTSTITGTTFAFLKLSASLAMAGYAGSSTTVYAAAYAQQPILTINNLIGGMILNTTSYTVTGTAYAPLGISAVWVTLDSGTSTSVPLTALGSGAVSWSYSMTGLSTGTHTLIVKVVSNNGVVTEQSVSFSYHPTVAPNYTPTAIGYSGLGLGLIGLIVALVALVIALRKPKQPIVAPEEEKPPETPPETPTEATTEEKPPQ